jgi:hypothetical protein
MNLLNILLEKAKKDEIGHFYILEGPYSSSEQSHILKDFVHQFIKRYYQDVEHQNHPVDRMENHPDIIFMGSSSENNNTDYTVEEYEDFVRFFDYTAIQSKRKFAIISEAKKINTHVANRLLKLLEEPYSKVTIFLLNPHKQKLLDTIHSRAIHLRIPNTEKQKQTEEWSTFINQVKTLSLHQFLEEFSKAEKTLDFWTQKVTEWESEQFHDPLAKEALEKWIKLLTEMNAFNQPTATKWTLFYSYLRDHVLPRLSR